MRIENTFGIEAEALAVIKYDSEKGLTNALKRLHEFNAELPILLIGQGSNLLLCMFTENYFCRCIVIEIFHFSFVLIDVMSARITNVGGGCRCCPTSCRSVLRYLFFLRRY